MKSSTVRPRYTHALKSINRTSIKHYTGQYWITFFVDDHVLKSIFSALLPGSAVVNLRRHFNRRESEDSQSSLTSIPV